ncbi:YchJ family protein [Herbaspirillum sp. RV1423]|uniref:YchJ family protein n=1 Tax=Herbaspirillum sp. RV1423 TaxID=1443993 RepID=UPI0004B44E1C|nr:YchJ family metal-binding protein [Herbaspirillum sp. RV1423]
MAGKSDKQACPCGKGMYAACCGRFISGAAVPATAEQLMRSRYTAFALREEAYLRSTWHPDTLPDEPITAESDVKWIGLDVIRQKHEKDSDEATVEFIARFKVGGRAHRLHEVSSFVRQTDAAGVARWYYVDGAFPDDE